MPSRPAPPEEDPAMMFAHYVHRLPAEYDIGLIRSRANLRGERWSAARRF